MSEAKFWCCYVEGSNGFRFKHESKESALQEAGRLARLDGNNGRNVYVLEAISSTVTDFPPIKTVNL